MKYKPLVIALAALAPSLAYAQNQQFSDCRTVEAAGNFIGSDEVLVNGLVCKVAKRKANSGAPSQAAANATERSEALLGIVEPEVLRSKEKAETGAGGAHPTPMVTPGPAPAGSSSVTSPKPSLGEIARAYRESAKAQVADVPVGGDLGHTKPKDGVEREVTLSNKNTTTALQEPPAGGTAALPVAEAPQSATKTQAIAAVPAKTLSVPQAPPPASNQVAAVTQPQPPPTKPEASPAIATPPQKISTKLETNSSPIQAAPSVAPKVQGSSRAETLATGHSEPSKEQVTASAAPTSLAPTSPAYRSGPSAPERQPERLSTAGVFLAPQPPPAAADSPSMALSYAPDEDGAFKEGQVSTCTKNVSLGSMEKEKLFLAIPEWALIWYGKNQKTFPRICFSDSVMPGAKNYLIVFYTATPQGAGTEPLTNSSSLKPASLQSGSGSFTTSYGSMWHYTEERMVTTTITSLSAEKAPHNLPSSLVYATAYTEQGVPVSRRAPGSIPKPAKKESKKAGKGNVEPPEFRVLEGLLGRMVADIAKL